jgi:5-methyltetrahydropteroyltriglutamate--homocysteine methyltransferase
VTPRTTPPFRADHVGSLLRPPALKEARHAFSAGQIDAGALRSVEDAAIANAVELQLSAGLQGITDGELRRGSWHMDFIYELDGVSRLDSSSSFTFHSDEGDVSFTPSAMKVDGRLGLSHTIFGDAFSALTAIVGDRGLPKLTVPSPSMLHYRGGRPAIDTDIYPEMGAFWSDLETAYRDEVTRLGELGCAYLQFDDISFAYLNDPHQREHVRAVGGDPEHQHEEYIAHLNAAIGARPDGMAVTTHMCRGNFRSSWVAEGGYDYVAEALFNDLAVDGFFMEWDDERSGGFEPLRFVPKGKVVVLGLITTKRPTLEAKDDVKRRIEEAARHIDVDQLCLSPQCGFSSTLEGNALTAEDQAAKLRLVVEVADEVWGS